MSYTNQKDNPQLYGIGKYGRLIILKKFKIKFEGTPCKFSKIMQTFYFMPTGVWLTPFALERN